MRTGLPIPLVLLLAVVGGSSAEPSGSYTAGAVIRFPADDLTNFNKQASYNNVQGISYYATGPNSGQPFQQSKMEPSYGQAGLFSGGQETHSFALSPGIQDNFHSSSYPFPSTASTYLPKYPPQPFPQQHLQSHSSTQYAPVLSALQVAASSQYGSPHTPNSLQTPSTFEQLYPSPSLSTPSPFAQQSIFPSGQYASQFSAQSNENLPQYTQQFPPQSVQHSPQLLPQFPQHPQPSPSQYAPQFAPVPQQSNSQYAPVPQQSNSQYVPVPQQSNSQYAQVPQQSNSQYAPQTFPTTPSPHYQNQNQASQNQASYSNPSFVNPNQNRNPSLSQYQVAEDSSYDNNNQHTQQHIYQQNNKHRQQSQYFNPMPSQHSDVPYNHKPSYQQQPMKGFTYGPPKVNLVSHRTRKPSYSLRPNGPKYHKYKGNSYQLSAEGSSHHPTIYGRPQSRPPIIPHSTKHLGLGMVDAFFSGKPVMPPARDPGYNTITKEMLSMKPQYEEEEGGYDEGPNYQYKRVSTGNEGQNKRVKDAHDAGVHGGGGQKTPVVVYKGMRPPVSVYHKQQVTTTKKNPGQYQQRQQVVPADLAGGRSAGSTHVTAAPEPSNWVPINAHDGAVPARAYTIQAPDLSRSDQVAAHEFTGNVEIESQPIVGHKDGKHGVLHDNYPRGPDAGAAGAPKFPRRPEMTERRIGIGGSSEEVVSAVVLVKQ